MAHPWHQQQQLLHPDVAWLPTPASAFQVASAPGALSQQQQRRQRIGQQQHQQQPPPSSWPGAGLSPPSTSSPSPPPPPLPILLLGAPATAGPKPNAPPPPHHYVEDRITGQFRRLRPWELPALALAQAEAAAGGEAAGAVAELLRLQQQRQQQRAGRPARCCLPFRRRDQGTGEDEDVDEDDDVRVSNLLLLNEGANNSNNTALLTSTCRTSAQATTPCDPRLALTAIIIPLATLVQGLSCGAAAGAAAAAYAQSHAREASLDDGNPEVWTVALIDAFGSGAGVRFGRGLLALSALSAVLAAAAAGLPSLSSASKSLRRAWPAAALLFAAAHVMGLVAATPAEADLAARPRPRLVPLLWHAATVGRALLFAGGWLAACWALGERALEGERAARRGRAAAWRASVYARALALRGE